MYTKLDSLRPLQVASEKDEFRSQYRRDYARIIHSASFRRLQGKTQLFPGVESDFFRNRLTHSLEVAQIAKSIALKINKDYGTKIDEDICELAGLAHDLGHPPFGHQGEEALDECLADSGGFEGNAQTLRILARLEKKHRDLSEEDDKSILTCGFHSVSGEDYRYGLNLTYRSLASVLKYDKVIPFSRNERDIEDSKRPIKGYYRSEQQLVKQIKKHVSSDASISNFKTVECQIMDIADDIAYSTYDLEDGLKARFYNPIEIIFCPNPLLERIASALCEKSKKDKQVFEAIGNPEDFEAIKLRIKDRLFEIFGSRIFKTVEIKDEDVEGPTREDLSIVIMSEAHAQSELESTNSFFRTALTSGLIKRFIGGIQFELTEKPELSKVYLDPETRLDVEILKTYVYESQILSPKLKVAEYRGKEIVKTIFKALDDDNEKGWQLLPKDHREIFQIVSERNESLKKRVIGDYIAGMTDRYAIEFYGRLKSEDPATIFKPF